MPASRQSLFRPALLLLGTLALQACAQQTTQPITSPNAAQLTHACQPTETVGFSCQLQDGQVLSLCASPGFNDFKGKPIENPGYAYLALINAQGLERKTYPADAREYKKHMFTGVTMAAWPYLVVATAKGDFFYVNENVEMPVSATRDNLPPGWSLPPDHGDSLCKQVMHRDHLSTTLLQIVDEKERDALLGESPTR